MAKLKAPFMSLGASGQLGKSVVAFGWKGIDCLREYVVPANPNTTAQQSQRTKMTDAGIEWHAALYSAGDKIAWNRFAGILKDTMSGFNAMIQTWIKEKILANVWYRIRLVSCYFTGPNSLNIRCESEHTAPDPILYWGTSKTNLPNTITGIWQPTEFYAFSMVGLTANTLYYYTIKRGTSGSNYGRTGLYQQKTSLT